MFPRVPFIPTIAMYSSSRILTRNLRPISRVTQSPLIRLFHTPFSALSDSPLTSSPPPKSSVTYEKQSDHSPDPIKTPSGTHTYVVSEPDASDKFYEVPSGAYPTSAPYINFTATEAPNTSGAQFSSTSSTPLAHEQTTRRVLKHEGGVGESAAVRYAEAPGQIGERGGSHGGPGLMDKKGTMPPETPIDRNPPPDSEIAETFSKRGVREAWKDRK